LQTALRYQLFATSFSLTAPPLTVPPLTASSLTVPPLIYNFPVLALAQAAMTAATWIFFIGVAGSLLVILISFFEDLTELIGKD